MECILRKWSLADAADLAQAINNPNIQNNLRDGIPYPYTQEDAAAFIRSMLNADPDTTFAFAITWEGRVVGSIGIFRQSNIHFRTAELGYYLAESVWGKGLATSAVTQATDFVFSHTDIVRIFAEPFAYNHASCRVLEKCGFQYEGTLRSNAFKQGRLLDMKLYARLRDLPKEE